MSNVSSIAHLIRRVSSEADRARTSADHHPCITNPASPILVCEPKFRGSYNLAINITLCSEFNSHVNEFLIVFYRCHRTLGFLIENELYQEGAIIL